jgi:hypothetical protein
MTTDTNALLAKVEEATAAYEKDKAEREAKAQADAEAARVAEFKFFMAQIGSLEEGPAIVKAAHVEFVEAARSGDLQAAFSAWMELEKVKAEQREWSLLVHRKLDISWVEPQKSELLRKLDWAERKRAGLASRLDRGAAERLAYKEWAQQVASLQEQLAQLEKLGDNPTLPAVPPQGAGDFSKALWLALEKGMRADGHAYVNERTAGLAKTLKG